MSYTPLRGISYVKLLQEMRRKGGKDVYNLH